MHAIVHKRPTTTVVHSCIRLWRGRLLREVRLGCLGPVEPTAQLNFSSNLQVKRKASDNNSLLHEASGTKVMERFEGIRSTITPFTNSN
jgi:hypothetical protein